MNAEQRNAAACLKVGLLYMMRPHCHMICQGSVPTFPREKSHLKFFGALSDNAARFLGSDTSELYCQIVARMCRACSVGPEEREELLMPVLAMIDVRLTGQLPDYVEWTGTQEDLNRTLAVIREERHPK